MKIVSRITYIFCFILFGGIVVDAQIKHANEWINPSKQYLKLKVAENGIYRVTYEELQALGFVTNAIDGTALQLLNFGTEQALYVSNNDFGPGSHFEFYGKKNTIGLDSLLYDDWQKDLFNTEYSLVNDTNAYFLTLAPETSNKRFTLVQPNYNNITIAPFPYYLHEEKIAHGSTFYKNVDGDIRFSNFEPSEGFGTAPVQTSTTTFPVSQLYNNASKPVLEFRTGANGLLSRIDISWNNQLKETKIINPKLTSSFSYDLDNTELLSNNTLNIKNTYSVNDRHRLAYAKLTYARSFDFNNKEDFQFLMPASATALRLLEISNFKSNNQVVFLYDIDKNIRYSTQVNNAVVKVQINPSATQSKFILINENAPKKVPQISEFKPKAFGNNGQEYVIISNKSLYNSGPDYVTEYAEYRSSSIGGGYKTEIVEIQDIYDHFGYGIDRHFVGVKQFAAYMKDNWDATKFVFIIGKGVEYPGMRTANDINNNNNKSFFIPTFGFTGSDNMLFSEGNMRDPNFAIGRLAARTQEDIKNYLNKIVQYEKVPNSTQTIDEKFWLKNIMHLGGGTTPFEQTTIKTSLSNLKNEIETNDYGGKVFSFFKTSSDPIQVSTSEQLLTLINNGVSLITFFGHSGTGTFDFAIENPNKFTNFGKYHIVNSLGCYAGNIHSSGSSISESFVLEKDKGAVAFIASSGTAYISNLNDYSKLLYQYLGNKQETFPIGKIVQLINQKYNFDTSQGVVTLFQQLTYHGDPAIRLFKDNLPDYLFDGSSVKINDGIITTNTKTIDFKGNIVNLGANVHQAVNIKSELIHPDGSTFETRYDTFFIDKSLYSFNISFNLGGEKSGGINKIISTIDFENKITEGPEPGAKQNNELTISGNSGFEFFVSNNDIRLVYPDNFSILNKSELQLIAVNSDLFAPKNTYYFELDTIALFNSGSLQKYEITQNTGGAIIWKPTISLIPNKVYYWRVAPKPDGTEGYQWRNSSFVYIPSSPSGWNQSHFYQHLENNFTNLSLENDTKKLKFVKNLSSAIITNGLFPKIHPEIKINSDPFRYIRFDAPILGGVYVSVFDPITGQYWRNQFPSLYGSTMNSPWATGWGIFPYHTRNSDQRKLLIDFLEKTIPDGYYVTIFSIQRNDLNPQINYDADKWDEDKTIHGTTLFEIFEKQGIKNLRSTINTKLPFILAYKKGDPSYTPTEEYAQNETDELRSVINVETFWTEGSVETSEIGPAKKWNKLIWNETDYNATEDVTSIIIYGVKINGQIDTLKTNLKSYEVDLSDISASDYPYLKLEYLTSDKTSRTSAHLPLWKILYEGLPDIILDATSNFEFYKDTLIQGETMRTKFGILNASNVDIKPFTVEYKVNQPNNSFFNQIDSIGGISACQYKLVDFKYGTTPYFGDHALLININNDVNNLEKNKSNNISSKKFFVEKDKNAPLLDVIIDGIHIMDEDIISPKPKIEIVIKDEGSFLKLNDIKLIEAKLYTAGNQEIDIPQNELYLTTDEALNTMKLLFTPTLVDGEYRLEVQAKDKSGNKSGVNPYSIRFKVITKNSVTQVLNYPNPFSTNTQFVFTLTGQEVPENFNISIYTLTGKLVKEITKNDLGTLRIGTNRTSYKWDGTDEYGSKLANGVYLYKVNINDKSEKEYEQMKTKTDALFNQGFGKLVILR